MTAAETFVATPNGLVLVARAWCLHCGGTIETVIHEGEPITGWKHGQLSTRDRLEACIPRDVEIEQERLAAANQRQEQARNKYRKTLPTALSRKREPISRGTCHRCGLPIEGRHGIGVVHAQTGAVECASEEHNGM